MRHIFPFSSSVRNCNANSVAPAVLMYSVLLLCFAINGCGSKKTSPSGQRAGGGTPPVTEVITDEVKQRDIQLYIYVPGLTTAYKYVDITARVPGYLEKLYFQNGSIVKTGDKLALIEQDQYKIALKAAEAALDSSRAKESMTRANLERAKQLIESRAMSGEEFNQRQAEYDMARAATAGSAAAVEQAKLNLQYTEISAPIPGKTTKNLVDVGNFVSSANKITATGASGESIPSDKLLSIAQMDPMYVDFQISDKQFADLKERMGFRQSFDDAIKKITSDNKVSENTVVQASATEEKKPEPAEQKPAEKNEAASVLPSLKNNNTGNDAPVADEDRRIDVSLTTGVDVLSADYPVRGKIVYLADNRITYATGQITLRGEVRNPLLKVDGNEDYMIYPGQICRVRIPYEKIKGAVLVREESILTDLDTKYVLVIEKETTAEGGEQSVIHRRDIKVGQLLDTQERIVESGLKSGEAYIVKGVQLARIGTAVKPVKLADFEKLRNDADK